MLVIFYRSLNGDEWTIKDGWTQDPTYECTWHGVVCDANGVVNSIDLSENNLRGEMPIEVALLVNISECMECSRLDEVVLVGKAFPASSLSFSFLVNHITYA